MVAKRWLMLVPAFLILLAALAWISLPGRIEIALSRALWAEGLPGAQVELSGWSLSGAQGRLLLDTACAPGCSAQFDIRYRPLGLWRREIDALALSGLVLDPFALNWQLPGPDRWRLPPVTIADALLHLPAGMRLQVRNARLLPVETGWQVGEGGAALLQSATGPLADLALGGMAPDGTLGFTLRPPPGGQSLSGGGRIGWLPGHRPWGQVDIRGDGVPVPGLGPVHFRLAWQAERASPGRAILSLSPPERGEGALRGGELAMSLTPLEGAYGAYQGELRATDIGLAAGPRDNSLYLPFRLDANTGKGWRLGALENQQGTLHLPSLGLAAAGLTIQGEIDGEPLAFTAAALRLGEPVPLLPSLQPTLTLHHQADGWEWRLSAPAAQPGLSLSGQGRIGGDGRFAAAVEITHRPPDSRPVPASRVSPWLGQWLTHLSGGASLSFSAQEGGQGSQQEGALTLEGAGIGWPGGSINGLQGRIRLSALSPLRLERQDISIGALTAGGITVLGGKVAVELPGDGVLRTGPVAMQWQGLPVDMAPLALALGGNPPPLSLVLPPTPLDRLLVALGADGLTGEGAVAGTLSLPLRDGGDFAGEWQAQAPGRLHYDGPAPPSFVAPERNQNLALVTQALRDFRFRSLGLRLGPDGPVLAIEGNNPGFYGGYDTTLSLSLRPTAPVGPVP